jgi:hypothetical protein
LQEDEEPTLHIIAAALLYDGKQSEAVFEMMQSEGCFSRLVELIQNEGTDEDLPRMLMDLLYEMARMQRLTYEDLGTKHCYMAYEAGLTYSLSICRRHIRPISIQLD